MPKSCHPLTYEERCQIEALTQVGTFCDLMEVSCKSLKNSL